MSKEKKTERMLLLFFVVAILGGTVVTIRHPLPPPPPPNPPVPLLTTGHSGGYAMSRGSSGVGHRNNYNNNNVSSISGRMDVRALRDAANSILDDVLGYVDDRMYNEAPHLSGRSAFGMLASYNSPDPGMKDSGKLALISEEATREVAKRYRLTRHDIYHVLPKVPIANPKLDGLCEMAHEEEPDEHGYAKRNASRRSIHIPPPPLLPPLHPHGGKRRSYGGAPPPQQDYGHNPYMEEHGGDSEEEDDEVNCDDIYYRSFDGSCNNLKYPLWGRAGQAYSRLLLPDYADGVASPRVRCDGSPLPSTRVVSLVLNRPARHYLEAYTHMVMQWGQFISHDLTFKPDARAPDGAKLECCGEHTHPECLPISIPRDDPFYSKYGLRCMEFARAVVAKKQTCGLGTREQVNQATSYIDASHVYGHSDSKVEELRTFQAGFLKTDERTPYFLPEGEDDECRSHICFAAGDARVNQQPALMALHTMWMREHNRLAEQLYTINPHWDDEKLFQESRRIVATLFQHITYKEYLPVILGPKYIKDNNLYLLEKGYFTGYNEYIDPAVSNVFSVAAYRFGHSMVRSHFARYSHDHYELPTAPPLWEDFFNSTVILEEYGIDQVVLGLLNQWPYYVDDSFTPQLRNHLFEQQGDGWGLDLVAINIQRGREVGLPSYNEWRDYCGLGRLYRWEDLHGVMHADTVAKLSKLYGNVDDIDLYPAGVSEIPQHGALIGPTFACLVGKQYYNLRYGDRFWYENGGMHSSFTPYQLDALRKVTLARVICDNMYGIYTLQPYVMRAYGPGNERVPCDHPSIPLLDLSAWKENYVPSYGK